MKKEAVPFFDFGAKDEIGCPDGQVCYCLNYLSFVFLIKIYILKHAKKVV